MLRSAAADLLSDVGEPAVLPLVDALFARPGEIDREGSLRVLERASIGARSGGHAAPNLARAIHRMLVEPLDVDELCYLATTIEWWHPALELHRTFSTAKKFLELESLGGIAGAEVELEWIDGKDEGEDWLRPAAQRALRQLRLISQAVQYHSRASKRSAKEKGLLTATARVNELHAMVGELGEPHDRVFHDVAESWRELINHAIREFQGRAELDLEIRTDNVRIRDIDTTAVLVFEVFNRGEGLASNVQLSLISDAEGALDLQSGPTHFLPPLGQGDRLSVEFTVQRQGAGVVPLTLEMRYDDPQSEGLTRRFAREVRFFIEEAEYREIGTSPYIAGPPVKSREMFYGRQTTFQWVQENLSGTYQANVLVLYGERRTGKTSVLYQLQYHLPDQYAFVLIDLQSIAYALNSTSDLLFAIARKASSGLKRQGFQLEKPRREDYADHPLEQFEQLGEELGRQATESGRRAVIIADEFDLLIEAVEKEQVSAYVFDCIRGLMQHQEGLSFIFAGAHKVTEMLKNPHSILFNTALRRRVSYLVTEEAERLIREPVADVLWYDDLAVEKILRVTAGQPYFIQYICHEIVNLARHDRKNFVTLRDVDRALQTTVEETTGIIRHAYMSLGTNERLLLAALSRITDDGRPFVGMVDILETLGQDEVTLAKRDAHEHMRTLTERDFVTERGSEGTERQYGFTMELVRVWLERNDEYTRLLEEIRHG
jgi:Cdc6-like AAA superfamily ATPase